MSIPMDRAAIEAAIPHRDPFLFLDRIDALGNGSIEATWTVPADADWFRGHYPDEPILPGVLISEHVFQAAAVLLSVGGGGSEAGSEHVVPVLVRIESARYRRMVRPGETLETTVTLEEQVGPAWFLEGRVTCGGEKVLQIRFALTRAAAPVPDPQHSTETETAR